MAENIVSYQLQTLFVFYSAFGVAILLLIPSLVPLHMPQTSYIADFSRKFPKKCLLGHFNSRYLSPGCPNIAGKPRNGVFRSSRYGFKKISSKNINFSQSYRSQQKCFFCRHFCPNKLLSLVGGLYNSLFY